MPSRLLIALLSASLSLTAAAVVQLLPAGEFAARLKQMLERRREK